MEAAPAILLIGGTLTRGVPPCLRTAPLPRPARPEPPLDTDCHVVFCKHEYHPAYEVLLYRKLSGASRRVELSPHLVQSWGAVKGLFSELRPTHLISSDSMGRPRQPLMHDRFEDCLFRKSGYLKAVPLTG